MPISSSAEFSAAWASFNVELQQYLINASRSDDALMVSKYYSQIVRLLTDYSSQWKLVMELDEYIRGATFTVVTKPLHSFPYFAELQRSDSQSRQLLSVDHHRSSFCFLL